MTAIFGHLCTLWKDGKISREIVAVIDGVLHPVVATEPAGDASFESGIEKAVFSAAGRDFDAVYSAQRQDVMVEIPDILPAGRVQFRSNDAFDLSFMADGSEAMIHPNKRSFTLKDIAQMTSVLATIEEKRLQFEAEAEAAMEDLPRP